MRSVFKLLPEQFGGGPIAVEWGGQNSVLAVAGHRRSLVVFNRDGTEVTSFSLEAANVHTTAGKQAIAAVSALVWNTQASKMVVLPSESDFFFIYDALTGAPERINCGAHIRQQDLTAAVWSSDDSTLAVGTSKGSLLMYSVRTRKIEINITARHEKAIICGAACMDVIAMASKDRSVSITNTEGMAIARIALTQPPAELVFNKRKVMGGRSDGAIALSVNIGNASVVLYDLLSIRGGAPAEGALNLTFLPEYGSIQYHFWCASHCLVLPLAVMSAKPKPLPGYGDGYIGAVFNKGRVVVVSTHTQELANEVHNVEIARSCTSASYCKETSKLAVAGGHQVWVMTVGAEVKECPGERVDLAPNESIARVLWTSNGQILTVTTTVGVVHSFLGAVPLVHGAHACAALFLTSLSEAAVQDVQTDKRTAVPLTMEPHFLALGPTHLLAGVNNSVTFHLRERPGNSPQVRQYSAGTVQAAQLNSSHAALLIDGRITVHPLNFPPQNADQYDTVVPKKDKDVVSFALTEDFLVLGTQKGMLRHYQLQSAGCALLNEFRHGLTITSLWAAHGSASLVFCDSSSGLFLFSPVTDSVLPVPGIEGQTTACVFDCMDPSIFLVADATSWHILVHTPMHVDGPSVRPISRCDAVPGCTPLTLQEGSLLFQMPSGHISTKQLGFCAAHGYDLDSKVELEQALRAYALDRAWTAAQAINKKEGWARVAEAAMQVLDLETAVAAYRQAGDSSMVLALEMVQHLEDCNLRAGHVLVLLGTNYDAAQELFLRSSDPKAALEMRKDLRHWEQALKLAEQLDPQSLGLVMAQYGMVLEAQGEAGKALHCYQEAATQPGMGASPEFMSRCQAGMARCTLQSGDVRGGMRLALQNGSRDVILECASILEAVHSELEAAELYERCGEVEKAATIYVQAKAFARAAPLMQKIKNPKHHLSFAKAKEAEGRYQEAVESYERAGDSGAMVRLLLNNLSNSNKAFAIARTSRHKASASMVARYCLSRSNWESAVEFLMLCGDVEEAWALAQTHAVMHAYSQALGADATPTMHSKVALYYQNAGEPELAAAAYTKANQLQSAVTQLMRVPPPGKAAAIQRAIDLVKSAPVEQAGPLAQLVHSSMDRSDKDAFGEHFFALNIALGNYSAAGLSAIAMATVYQRNGEYKVAHKKLLDAHNHLRGIGQEVPQELFQALAVIHSYILVRARVQLGDHEGAARLLVRVADHISRFERHTVPILTSCVIECQRAGLKRSAHDVASTLMRKEYRDQIAPAHKRKIESIVRKPEKGEEPADVLQACSWCGVPGKESELQCGACQNQIPFCIVTGKRMVLTDWTQCVHCKFPGRLADMRAYLAEFGACPMCTKQLSASDLALAPNPLAAYSK